MSDELGAAQNLVLEVQRSGGATTATATVTIRGELDVSTAPDLAAHCRVLQAEGIRELVLDLEHATFLDSSGLRALIGARHLFDDAGGSVRLANPSDAVARLLAITGLTGYFSIDDTRPS